MGNYSVYGELEKNRKVLGHRNFEKTWSISGA
jgi:hypothetical protein